MITKNSLRALIRQDETSLEYELVEKWLETAIEPQLIALAKRGEAEYGFVVYVSEANPSMVRKALSDRGFDTLVWSEPINAKPPFTRMRIKVLW